MNYLKLLVLVTIISGYLLSLTFSLSFDIEIQKKDNKESVRLLEEVTFPLGILKTSQYILKASIGTPKQDLNFVISLSSPFTWVRSTETEDSRGFLPSKSSTFQKDDSISEVFIPNEDMKGNPSYDFFSFPEAYLEIEKFPFLITQGGSGNNYDGTIGFSLTLGDPVEKKYSFLETLFQLGKINKKVFYIQHINEKQAKRVIGTFPTQFEIDREHFHSYKFVKEMKSNYNNFTINVNAMFFSNTNSYKKDNNVYYLNVPFRFDSFANVNIVSHSVFNHIRKNLFEEAIKNKNCFESIELQFFYIYCNGSFNKDLGTINIVLDNWTYQMDSNDYFLPDGNKKFFLFITLHRDEFVLANPFLKKYLTVFDIHTSRAWIYHGNKK